MSKEPVEARMDELDGAGDDLTSVSERLANELQAVQAEFASLGDAFGGDEIGMLIGVTHQVVSEFMMEKLGELREELGLDGDAVKRMSQAYREVEEQAGELLKKIAGDASSVS